jgi:hypothetical protein
MIPILCENALCCYILAIFNDLEPKILFLPTFP